MHYTYAQLAQGIALAGITIPVMAADVSCTSKLLIENRSGWAITIFYNTVAGKLIEVPMRQSEKLKELPACLDNIASISFERRGKVWGMGAAGVSLDDQLISLQKRPIKNKDAVIVIEATMTSWKTSTRWEAAVRGSLVMPEEEWQEKQPAKPAPVKPAQPVSSEPVQAEKRKSREMEKEAVVSLSDVQNGKLGEDYKQKVKDIIDTDYAQAKEKGKVNLAVQLSREFSEISAPKALKGTPTPETVAPTKISTQDAKQIIDRLSRTLAKYRTQGLVK